MQRQRFTVRSVLRGTYEGLDDEEASQVNRYFRISLAVGVLAGVIAFFTIVGRDDVLRTRLYGAGGVVLFVTVALFVLLSAAGAVLQMVDLRRRGRR